MDAQYELNAVIISLLIQQIAINRCEIEKRLEQCNTLSKAYRYMLMIIKALRDHPGLQDEWLVFLECAGIEEPEWKADYTSVVLEEY